MTDITGGGAWPGRAKLKITIRRIEDKPEPSGRASWEIYGRRWLVSQSRLGYVNAVGHADALSRARKKWPDEKHLTAYPA